MKHYETTISFSYYAENPEEAAQQFLANIPIADWYINVKDLESCQEYTVDSETNEVEIKY